MPSDRERHIIEAEGIVKTRLFLIPVLTILALNACSFAGYTITKDIPATDTPSPTATHVVTIEEEAYIACLKFFAKQFGVSMQLADPYQPNYVTYDGRSYTATLNYSKGAFYSCQVFPRGDDSWSLMHLK